MKEPDTLSDKDIVMEQQLPSSQYTIPQIILTGPPSQSSDSINEDITDQPFDTLTPPKPQNSPPLNALEPLPLTKDLLKRKNKLDKLLQQQERNNYLLSGQTVDERVTAGLGISTYNNNILSPGLRSRRRSSSNKSDLEKSNATSRQQSEWSYELKSITSESRKHSNTMPSGTSGSGSSVRNSMSMKAISATHRYMDRHDENSRIIQYYERPIQSAQRNDSKSKYYFLDLFYQAVIRVVHSRAPESKEIEDKEVFKMSSNMNQHTNNTIPPQHHHLPIESVLPSVENEKLDYLTTKQEQRNSIDNNRFSWLSYATTISLQDDESFHYTPKIKKSSLSSEEIIPPNPLQGNSLFLFSPNNPFRILVWKFIRKR